MNSQRTGASKKLVRAATPIRYKGAFKNMEEVYRHYRNGAIDRKEYDTTYDKLQNKRTEYTREPLHDIGERVRTEQSAPTQYKIESNSSDTPKQFPSIETQQKDQAEKQNYDSTSEKDLELRADTIPQKRPSQYEDKIESRW